MTKTSFLLGSLLMSLLAGGCVGHVVYSSGPYNGKVVDAETKKPLVGAAVLAIWYREAMLFGGHGPAVDYHDALEVLTDTQGEFIIPQRTHLTWIGKIREPALVVYNPGYAPYPSSNARPGDHEVTSMYEKQSFSIELPKLKTREERIRRADVPVSSKVPESKMPNLIRLLNKERVDLGLQPIGRMEATK